MIGFSFLSMRVSSFFFLSYDDGENTNSADFLFICHFSTIVVFLISFSFLVCCCTFLYFVSPHIFQLLFFFLSLSWLLSVTVFACF